MNIPQNSNGSPNMGAFMRQAAWVFLREGCIGLWESTKKNVASIGRSIKESCLSCMSCKALKTTARVALALCTLGVSECIFGICKYRARQADHTGSSSVNSSIT